MQLRSIIGGFVFLAGVLLVHTSVSNAAPNRLAFATCSSRRPALQTRSCQFLGNQFRVVSKKPMIHKRSKTTTLSMFMGTDGGILGVGTPEVFTVLLVGYFVLGPSDLYKIVKEIGKFIQNFRTLGTDLAKTVENNFESQLQLEEIRKAQRELNDAFSFRRTINTDEEIDAFASVSQPEETVVTEASAATATAAGAASATTTTKKRKVRRRRVKKQPLEEAPTEVPATSDVSQIEDLDMTSAFEDKLPPVSEGGAAAFGQQGSLAESEQTSPDWFNTEGEVAAAEAASSAAEQDRFASQLSDSWNQQILANEDKLSPLSKVMERLAILEEEKKAANERLEEEFRLRAELEEKYYKQKRKTLEEAVAEVQAEAYVGMDSNNNEKENTDAVQG